MAFDSNNFLQQLKDKINIVDVISDYVTLQKRGRDFWACCPFHHEKTPSFQVKSYHQVYRCYGCQKKGDAINFVMEMDKLSFNEAVEKLAKSVGLEVPERTIDPKYKQFKELQEKIYNVNRDAALFYHQMLKKEQGTVALEYLAGRGMTRETITKFGMGYSPDYDSLISYLQKKGYAIETMQEAGLVGVTENNKFYDFFAKRMVIPIISAAGKVLGFTGRSLEQKPDRMKYKNTTTTPVFNKRKNLFGINMYKQYTAPSNRAMILVEGHMDVISMFQAGIYNVVASMGTALTIEQCQEIKKFCDIVYVSYDGDSAGQAATLKGLSLLKDVGLEVKVVQLTNGLDPDDYVRKFGKDGYLKLVDEAIPLIDFKLKKIEEKHNFKSYDDRAKYLREAVKVLNEIDEVEKAVYEDKVSQISGLSLDRVVSAMQVDKNEQKEDNVSVSNSGVSEKENKQEENALKNAEYFIVSAMIYGKTYVNFGDAKKEYFTNENLLPVFDYIAECAKQNKIPVAAHIYDLLDKKDADEIIDAIDIVKSENQATYYKQCLQKIIKNYKDVEMKKIVTELSKETDETKKTELKEKLLELTKK